MGNETRYCPQCGNMITSSGSCPNCGWKGVSSSSEQPKHNSNLYLSETMNKADTLRNVKIFSSILGGIAGVIITLDGFRENEMGDFTYFNLIVIGIGILIIFGSLFFLLYSITSYQNMNFQYFLTKSFLEARKESDKSVNESINETIKTFFNDSDSK